MNRKQQRTSLRSWLKEVDEDLEQVVEQVIAAAPDHVVAKAKKLSAEEFTAEGLPEEMLRRVKRLRLATYIAYSLVQKLQTASRDSTKSVKRSRLVEPLQVTLTDWTVDSSLQRAPPPPKAIREPIVLHAPPAPASAGALSRAA
jgi:hypothetical protein